jgi:hypothetical protein
LIAIVCAIAISAAILAVALLALSILSLTSFALSVLTLAVLTLAVLTLSVLAVALACLALPILTGLRGRTILAINGITLPSLAGLTLRRLPRALSAASLRRAASLRARTLRRLTAAGSARISPTTAATGALAAGLQALELSENVRCALARSAARDRSGRAATASSHGNPVRAALGRCATARSALEVGHNNFPSLFLFGGQLGIIFRGFAWLVRHIFGRLAELDFGDDFCALSLQMPPGILWQCVNRLKRRDWNAAPKAGQ